MSAILKEPSFSGKRNDAVDVRSLKKKPVLV
jgi:hypothetical protein